LLDLPATDSPDLGPLVPISWTQVALGAGVHLPGHSTWLTGFAPEARVTSLAERDCTVVLECVRSLNGHKTDSTEIATLEGAAILDLNANGLTDGDYRVVVSERTPSGRGKPKPVAHASFRLRSANNARVTLSDEHRLGHEIQEGGNATLTAQELNGHEG